MWQVQHLHCCSFCVWFYCLEEEDEMTDSVNTRELVLGILMEVTNGNGYSHQVLRAVLEKYQYLDKKERAFITRLSEGTIQHMVELDYIINQFSKVKVNKMKPVIRNILRMGVYQLKYMDSVPDSAACNEAVKLTKKKGFGSLSGFVNGVLRNVGRNLEQVTYPDESKEPIKALSVRYSVPEWLTAQWLEEYGTERTKQMMQAFLSDAPITIRTNMRRTTPEKLKAQLEAEGVIVERLDKGKYPELPYAFAISGFDYLNGLSSFREGLFYVQDVSSMLVAEWAAPKNGDVCIDVCGAPGGKSIHLAEKLDGTGSVEARDVSEHKVDLIRENIVRCKLSNVTAKTWDATVLDEEAVGKADIVIADLPCSGLGVLRKKSDIKYRMNEETQRELVALQRKMLHVVADYVKPGGTLMYSTCTIHRAENEENVAWFIEQHPEFSVEKMQQIFPEEHLGDGFFIAKLLRVEK